MWPTFLSSSEIHQIASHLGPIENLKGIQSDGYLVEVLIQLWDPSCSVFRVGNREINITIENVAGLFNLSVGGTVVLFPFASNKSEFYHFTRLKESVVQGSNQSVDVKFLFDQFTPKDGFERCFRDFLFMSKAM